MSDFVSVCTTPVFDLKLEPMMTCQARVWHGIAMALSTAVTGGHRAGAGDDKLRPPGVGLVFDRHVADIQDRPTYEPGGSVYVMHSV